MTRAYVLDANAVLDFLENNPGAQRVELLFQEARQRNAMLFMSAVNWGEVYYFALQHRGEEPARKALANLSRIPIELVPVDEAQALKAGEIKVRHKIPYVDALAAALAVLRDATLVTSDRDFEKLGKRVSVWWVNRP